MLKQIITTVAMVIATIIHAQTTKAVVSNGPIDTSFLKYKTIEEALGLPAEYSVKAYSFIYSNKGELFKWESAWNDNFHLAWVAGRASKGDKLIIENIVVVKDGVEKKWMSKTFTF